MSTATSYDFKIKYSNLFLYLVDWQTYFYLVFKY